MLSQLADRIYIYVLVIVAYNLTKTNLGVSVPMLSFGVPSVLFASFAGVYVDRWSRKSTMLVSDLLRGALILVIILLLKESLLWIFMLSFMIYTIAQFFAPAEASSLAEIVERENLIVANSLFMTTWMWTSVIGFGLGAPLVIIFGEQNTFLIASCLYFASAIAIFMVRLKKEEKAQVKESMRSVKHDLLMGFEFIRRKLIIRYSLLKMTIITSALAVICMLAIQFAENYIGIGAKNFGYLVIFAGAGMMIGMWMLGHISHYFKKSQIVFFGFVISGVALMFLAGTRNIYIALFYCAVLGYGNILINATLQTIIAHNTPRSLRGRVFGIQNMLINFAFTLPVVLFGALADYFSLAAAIFILGVIVLLSGFISIIPGIRHI